MAQIFHIATPFTHPSLGFPSKNSSFCRYSSPKHQSYLRNRLKYSSGVYRIPGYVIGISASFPKMKTSCCASTSVTESVNEFARLECDENMESMIQTESIFQKCNQPVTGTANEKPRLRVVVVGDIHEEWDLEDDKLALQMLRPDLVLFTGDIGNENVELVRSVANLDMPKAVILGNHDSWGTRKFSSKFKDNVQLMLECLGDEHVGYSRLDFPLIKLSVVGGRPFSVGGDQLFRKKLLAKRWGIKDIDGSAKLISKAALGTPEDHLVIFLAHNGPAGLGSNINDICGRTWCEDGGDHGDPDLAQCISHLKETTKLSIPLVVFGHMHKDLEPGNRKMVVAGDDNTVYVNGAIVPRVKKLVEGTIRAFTLVELLNNVVSKITETWVSVIGNQATIESEEVLQLMELPCEGK